jgi:Flp pilus assembly protein TadG
MTGMLRACRSFLGRYWRDRSGVAGYFMVVSVVALVGMSGYAIDIGHVLLVQRQLQTATDAAALAGATQIVGDDTNGTTNSKTYATNYSALSGDKNASGVSTTSVSMVKGYPVLACFASVNYPACTPGSTPTATPKSGSDNGIIVEQQAVVKTWFLKLVGLQSMTVTSTATASASGGPGTPLNVMILLDTTASMATTDNSCGTNVTQETCALEGLQQLLHGLNQSIDYVGIMVFPGLLSTTQADDDTGCGGKSESPTSQQYNNISLSAPTNTTSTYEIATLQNTYQQSNTSNALNITNSALVNSIGSATTTGCLPAKPPGGQGTYYAGIITAAQNALVALSSTQTPPAQNVIILLSDGGANNTKGQTTFNGYVGTFSTANGITASKVLTVTQCTYSSATSSTPTDACGPSTTASQGTLAVGDSITGTGIPAGTTIAALGTGTGGTGTYTLSNSAAVGATTSVKKNGVTTYTLSPFYDQPEGTDTPVFSETINGTNYTSDANTDQCQQAVLAARAAAATGTWVYAVAYGSSNSASTSSEGCETDSTSLGISGLGAWLSTCQTMEYIANSKATMPDLTKFYSDGQGSAACTDAGTTGALDTLFENLSVSLTQARVIPNNST